MNYEENKKNSIRIIEVTKAIADIYDNLTKYKLMYNINKYNEYLQNLSIAIFVEDKIYEEISKNDIDGFESFLAIVKYNLNQKEYNNSIKEIIFERIENYINEIIYKNKYPYESEDMEEYFDQNTGIILLGCHNDHTKEYIELLEKKYLKTKSKLLKSYLTNMKYVLIFTNKKQESYYLNNSRPKRKSQKNSLLVHGHEYYMVEEVYSRYLIDTSGDLINLLLSETPENKSKFSNLNDKINLMNLEACINLMNLQDIELIYNNFHETYFDDNNNICFDNLPVNNINNIDSLLSNKLWQRIDKLNEPKEKTNTKKKY